MENRYQSSEKTRSSQKFQNKRIPRLILRNTLSGQFTSTTANKRPYQLSLEMIKAEQQRSLERSKKSSHWNVSRKRYSMLKQSMRKQSSHLIYHGLLLLENRILWIYCLKLSLKAKSKTYWSQWRKACLTLWARLSRTTRTNKIKKRRIMKVQMNWCRLPASKNEKAWFDDSGRMMMFR